MQNFELDITNKRVIPLLYAKQRDVGAKIHVVLTDNKEPYTVPNDVQFSVWFSGKSGSGNYTEIDGKSAFVVEGNTITVELIHQMLNNAGEHLMCLVMNDADGKQQGLWNIPYYVEAIPGADSEAATAYYNAFLDAQKKAEEAAERAEAAADRAESADPDCHAGYFAITEDGVLSLKPEYRGASTRTASIDSISDMGKGVAGSKNAELPKYLVIPEIVDGILAESFADSMFEQNRAVKQVVIPSTVSALPAFCFSQCVHLTDVYNTEHITSIGDGCFQAAGIKRACFPNLQTMGELNTFYLCGHLVYADIGNVSSIPKVAFERCTMLNVIKHSGTITTVGEKAFRNTSRLRKANFIGDLTNIGQYAFYGSKVDYDWNTLGNCTFGANATSLQLNPTDFWSSLTFTPCENPVPTHLSQYNPDWADVAINAYNKYSTSCSLFCDMHIYCGIKGLTLTSPEEFVAIVNAKNPDLLKQNIGYMTVDQEILTALGLNVTHHTEYNATTLQAIYDALAVGGYASVTVGTGTKTTGHAVTIYGITANGELMVADSSSNTYDDRSIPVPKYSLHYKKFLAPSGYGAKGGFIIVTPV